MSQPELDKVVAMSRIFGVTIDYLLKEEIAAEPAGEDFAESAAEPAGLAAEYIPEEEAEPVQEEEIRKESAAEGRALHALTVGEANQFIEHRLQCAPRIALGVALCIFSIAPLMGMLFLFSIGFNFSKNFAIAVGIAGMFGAIGAAVGIFISMAMRMQKYRYIGREPFDYAEGVQALIEERRVMFRAEYPQNIAIGVGFCLGSVVPVSMVGIMGLSEGWLLMGTAMLFVLAGCGVFLFVRDGLIMNGFTQLLQQGDYTIGKKRRRLFFGSLGENITNAIADRFSCLK